MGEVSHSTARRLAAHVMDMAAQAWQGCKGTAHRSRTDPRYLYVASAARLFFDTHLSDLPKPNDLMGLLQLARAEAMKSMRDGQGTAQPRTEDTGGGVTIQTETVNVTGHEIGFGAFSNRWGMPTPQGYHTVAKGRGLKLAANR